MLFIFGVKDTIFFGISPVTRLLFEHFTVEYRLTPHIFPGNPQRAAPMFLRIPEGIALGIVADTAPEEMLIGYLVRNLRPGFVKAGAEYRLDHVVAKYGTRIGLHMQRIAVTAVVLFENGMGGMIRRCLLYTSPSPRD